MLLPDICLIFCDNKYIINYHIWDKYNDQRKVKPIGKASINLQHL